MIHNPIPTSSTSKRKCINIDELFEAKRSSPSMMSLRQEFCGLLMKKKDYLLRQKRASLLVNPLEISDISPMHEFSSFFRKVSAVPMAADEHPAQLELIKQIVAESIIIEWPRCVSDCSDDTEVVDMAPLIHRARNVVKCRTSHPTMRIKVFAIAKDDGLVQSPTATEAFFRATLVKITNEEPRQVAGKMILTQREGTSATKNQDQCGAVVTNEGKLVSSQASSETESYSILDDKREYTVKTTAFKYENGVLCATFPEMGVTLNSMVDRRQLSTRYSIQVEVALNIYNKLIVSQTLLSHAFLIAITNDQTEPLLHSIFWNRLTDNESTDADNTIDIPLKWSVLRCALMNFIKSQLVHARSLFLHELCHIQCMILLPRVVRCQTVTDLTILEQSLYGNVKCSSPIRRHQELRDRLLLEEVHGDTLIERKEFMLDKCIALLDMHTELSHSVWLWLYKISEMIQDVGHRLCPSPVISEKKSSKTKKQMAACEEYQTMLSLFNKGVLTLTSFLTLRSIFKDIEDESALLVRFCDENCGYLSVVYGFDDSSSDTLIMGSLTAEQVKDFKQGLPEVLIDEAFPSKYDCIVKIDVDNMNTDNITVTTPRKDFVFHSYRTNRLQNDVIHVVDEETVRVNPLTGIKMRRSPPPIASPNILHGILNMNNGQGSPMVALPSLDSSQFLALLQGQLANLHQQPKQGGFDVGMFMRAPKIEEQEERNIDEGASSDVTSDSPPVNTGIQAQSIDSLLQQVLGKK